MTATCFACYLWALSIAGADQTEALFQEAEQLARSNQNAAALAKAEEAIREITRMHEANEDLPWHAMNGVRWTAQLLREDFLDYDKSLEYCQRILKYADSDYWRVPAWLEMAMTYRAKRDFAEAQRLYDVVAGLDERYRSRMLIPQAEMTYFEIGDRVKGRQLLQNALTNEAINGRERFNSLRNCASKALADGRREEAIRWYAMVDKLPFSKAEERAKFLSQAWYEMGKIEESRGRTAEAKTHYRNAMELDDGDMRFRTRSRDALESIEYFE